MHAFMSVAKALSDAQRVRLLLALRHQELCACQLVALVGLAASTVSKHMSILKEAGLVEGRKEGRWMYYRLAANSPSPMIRGALSWVVEHLQSDPQILQDDQRLTEICAADPDPSCPVPEWGPRGDGGTSFRETIRRK